MINIFLRVSSILYFPVLIDLIHRNLGVIDLFKHDIAREELVFLIIYHFLLIFKITNFMYSFQ